MGTEGGWWGVWKNERLRTIFKDMKRRCYNPNRKGYKDYGAKGIEVCKDWLDDPMKFQEWALLNGYADNLTIDRIDVNKGYSPDNCEWVTRQENTHRMSFKGGHIKEHLIKRKGRKPLTSVCVSLCYKGKKRQKEFQINSVRTREQAWEQAQNYLTLMKEELKCPN